MRNKPNGMETDYGPGHENWLFSPRIGRSCRVHQVQLSSTVRCFAGSGRIKDTGIGEAIMHYLTVVLSLAYVRLRQAGLILALIVLPGISVFRADVGGDIHASYGKHEAPRMRIAPDVPIPKPAIYGWIGEPEIDAEFSYVFGMGSGGVGAGSGMPLIFRGGRELIGFTELYGDMGKRPGSLPVIVDLQIKDGSLDVGRAATRDMCSLQFADGGLGAFDAIPANNHKAICEESNRGIGRLHVTGEFSPPAFLFPLVLWLIGFPLMTRGGLCEAAGGLLIAAGAFGALLTPVWLRVLCNA